MGSAMASTKTSASVDRGRGSKGVSANGLSQPLDA
jgi:hypothetical protein